MQEQIEEGKTYKRSSGDAHDVVKVLNIVIKNGEAVVHCLPVFKEYGDDFYVGAEDTKKWVRG